MTHQRGPTAEDPNVTDGRTDSTEDVSTPGALPDAPPPDLTPTATPFALLTREDVVPPDVTFQFLPVLAYDVLTVPIDDAAPGRLVVSVRLSRDAHAIAGRLNAMQSDGLLVARERYTVALPREIARDVPTDPDVPIVAANYELAPSALAVIPLPPPADRPPPNVPLPDVPPPPVGQPI